MALSAVVLRIHAGAPSNHKDDEKYRALAEASVGFVGTRHDLDAPALAGTTADAVLPSGRCQEEAVGAPASPLPRDEITPAESGRLSDVALRRQIFARPLPASGATSNVAYKRLALERGQDLEVPSPKKRIRLSRHSPDEQSSPSLNILSSQPVLGFKTRLIGNDVVMRAKKRCRLPTKQTALQLDRVATKKATHETLEQRRKLPGCTCALTSHLETPVPARLAKRQRLARNEVPLQNAPAFDLQAQRGDLHSSFIADHIPKRTSEKRLARYRERRFVNQSLLSPISALYRSDVNLTFEGGQSNPVVSSRYPRPPTPRTFGPGVQTGSELPSVSSLGDIICSAPCLGIWQHSTSDPCAPNDILGSQERKAKHRSCSWLPEIQSSPFPPRLKSSQLVQRPTNQASIEDWEADTNRAQLKHYRPADSPLDPTMLAALANLPYTIRPAEPAASVERPKTHITDSLQWLAEASELSTHFIPVSVSRKLRPLERGYWLVDPSSWPLELQLSFWCFLEKFIGLGNAGWGVWCNRQRYGATSLGPIQVFCWGEIVKHVYLLLYVASSSKVRRLGLRWIDANDMVVVQMRSN